MIEYRIKKDEQFTSKEFERILYRLETSSKFTFGDKAIVDKIEKVDKRKEKIMNILGEHSFFPVPDSILHKITDKILKVI